MAIQRIWRQHGLIHPRRRKYQRKQDLAAWKAIFRLFQQISADTKDLGDISHYWPQMRTRRLPAIQHTAREIRSGLQFLAYASRRSAGASALFADRIQRHLERCGVDLKHLAWQTDNGGEFIGELQKDGWRSDFPAAVTFFGSQHERIPPAAHTYQSDVETVHRLIEDEFFDLESFSKGVDFLAKASLYQLSFNLARPNSHKGGLTPWQVIHQLDPRLSLALCLLPPVFLDYRLNHQGGYDVPLHPYSGCQGSPPPEAHPVEIFARFEQLDGDKVLVAFECLINTLGEAGISTMLLLDEISAAARCFDDNLQRFQYLRELAMRDISSTRCLLTVCIADRIGWQDVVSGAGMSPGLNFISNHIRLGAIPVDDARLLLEAHFSKCDPVRDMPVEAIETVLDTAQPYPFTSR